MIKSHEQVVYGGRDTTVYLAQLRGWSSYRNARLARAQGKTMDDQQYPRPTAPPRQTVAGGAEPPPPSYDDVLVQEYDEHRRHGAGMRVANTLTSSMAFAGKFITRSRGFLTFTVMVVCLQVVH